MPESPLKYSDLFDFSDNGGVKAAIRDIKKLKDAYKDFTDIVTAGQFKMLSDQQRELAKTVAELAAASKDLNITQKQSQQQLLDNAAAMAKLEAANKQLNATQAAAKTTNNAVKGSVDQLNAQLKEQIKQYNALGQTKKRDIAAAGKLVQSINTTRAQLSQLNGAVRQNITAFTSAQGSYNRLDAETKKLIIDLKNLPNAFTTNAAKAKQMQAAINANVTKLKEFDKAMNITTRNVGNYSSAFAGFSAQLLGISGVLAIATTAISGVGAIIKGNAELSDSLAEVRRTAGLTEEEADALVETLKKIDTRTSLSGLLEIATIAGQLGIAKADIEGFTRAIDQLAVVLAGEIPGGAEAVATALGKINGVFDVMAEEGTSVEESFNKTGSAILGLGQAGLATGDFLVDFTQRVAGTAKQAGIALPVILAYGSVLEEAGKSSEVAGSSLNKIIAGLSVNRGKYFAIAQLADATLTLDEFKNKIDTDVNGALQLFFKGLNTGNPSQTEFADRLASIPRLAGETRSTIIALAQSQEKLSEKIKLSITDYNDSNKVSDQAKIKNDNLAGSIDKLDKVFENATTSGRMARFFKGFIDYLRISLEELNKLVNSKSWKEAFSRLGNGNGDAFELADTFGVNSRRTNNNQKFLFPQDNPNGAEDKLKAKGETFTKGYVNNLKKTYKEAEELTKKYEQGVKDGTLKENEVTVKDYKANLDKAKSYYESVLAIQKKLFPQVKKAEKNTVLFTAPVDDKKAAAEAKKIEAAEKKARDGNSKLLKLSAEMQVQDLENKYNLGKQDAEDQIRLEEGKFKVLSESYDGRKALYAKDSEDYKELELAKVKASNDSVEAIAKITKAANEKAIKEKEKLDKSIGGANAAQGGVNSATTEADIRKRQQAKSITDAEADKELFALRSENIQAEIDAAQDRMNKLGEFDSEYFDAKKDKLNAEKDLIKEKSDFEISQAQRAAEKRKEIEQEVYDLVSELSGSLFEIGSILGDGKIERLEHEKDAELAIAGTNAEAKAKIEENYNKKILAQKRKQAAFDKLEALFNIGLNTAIGISKATAALQLYLIPFIIASGAIQAATVLAKPLPKYKGGRTGGKGEHAIVNDGKGPELLQKGNKFRIAGEGKETITWLEPGEKVHTHENSARMMYEAFQDSAGANSFVDSVISGQNIVRYQEELKHMAIVNAILESKISKKDLALAVEQGLSNLEIQQLFLDEKGHRTFLKKKNQMILDQNARNTFGGQG